MNSCESVALTRLRVRLRDASAIDEAELARAGVAGTWRLAGGVLHLIVGEDADGIAAALAERAEAAPAGAPAG